MRYSKKDKIKWCSKNNNGLSIIEPNVNLARDYILKAEDSLKSMNENITTDWKISTSYYAIYFSLYAVLSRLGIKSEIHICTISFTENFLGNYYTEEEIDFIRNSLKARIDAQYYTDREVPNNQLEEMIKRTPEFIVKAKEIIIKLNEARRNEIRANYKIYIEA